MRNIFLVIIINVLFFINVFAQDARISIFGSPVWNFIKYKEFHTFANSYNALNNTNLKGFSKPLIGYSTGLDLYIDKFYLGFLYYKTKGTNEAIQISDIAERQFRLRSRNIGVNFGLNLSEEKYSIIPYASVNISNVTFLDAYLLYKDEYKFYGSSPLDGTYRGYGCHGGLGIKCNLYFLSPLFVSLSATKLWPFLTGMHLSDWDQQKLKNGYSEIGLDWGSFVKDRLKYSDDNGKYLSSKHGEFYIQLSIGFVFGEYD